MLHHDDLDVRAVLAAERAARLADDARRQPRKPVDERPVRPLVAVRDCP